MADIFISYSTGDHDLATSLCDILESNGISCWIAVRDLDTSISSRYADDIVEAIEHATVLILLLSRYSNESEHCMNEVTTACDKKKKVFVLQVEDVGTLNKTFNYYLSHQQWVQDFDVKDTGNFERIIRGVGEFLQVAFDNKKDGFVDRTYEKINNLKALAEKTMMKRQSYVLSIYDKDESEMDTSHIYEHIIRLDVVDSEKNKWSSYRFLTITNCTNQPSTYIVHKECGENKVSFRDMRVRAKQDGIAGGRLDVKSVMEIQPSFIQVFRIYFHQPLQPGESTTIFYRLDWPNEPSAYYKSELTQSISLTRYRRGVNKLTFAVFEPYRILSSSLGEIDDMNRENTSLESPTFLDITDEELLKPLHSQELFGVKYVIEDPQSKAYQINYSKETIDYGDEDEDDFF